MRLLRKTFAIVTAVYPPEPLVSAQISRDLASRLAELGHDVIVIRPRPSRPEGLATSYSSDSCRPAPGIKVITVSSYVHPKSGLLGRFLENVSFGLSAAMVLTDLRKDVDVVYMNAWPIFSQLIVCLSGVHFAAPVIAHVQDLYPEALIPKISSAGGRIVFYLLRYCDCFYARSASMVVVVSHFLRRVYIEERGIVAKRVTLVYNWQKADETVCHDYDSIRNRFGISTNQRIFLYFGNVGPVAGVEILIEAFGRAKIPDATLIIGGGGSSLAAAKFQASQFPSSRIIFTGAVDSIASAEIHSIADVCILPMRLSAGISSVPSKLTAYFQYSKPVIAAIPPEHEFGPLIREGGCGWVCCSEDVEGLAGLMKTASAVSSYDLVNMGALAKNLGNRLFSARKGIETLSSACLNASEEKSWLTI